MGAGSPKSNVLIIWIDKKVNNNENKDYQKELKKFDDFGFECFDNLEEGIKYIKEIKFKKTLIITSGSIYPELFKKFHDIINEITIIPKIFIFTSNANSFKSRNKDSYSIDDPFYYRGGVFDDIKPLKESILSSVSLSDKYNEIIKEDDNKYLKDERFSFEIISSKEELILPINYNNNMKSISTKEIKNFNKKILNDNKEIPIINKLFGPLDEGGKIPDSIMTKYWLRAYSAGTKFNDNMNKALLNNNYNDYLPMIIKLYKSVDEGYISTDNSTLYKGIIASKTYIEPLLNNKKNNNLPKGILYGGSFSSFYKDKSLALKFKNENESILKGEYIFILLILEETSNLRLIKNHASIKDISIFDSDKEIIFFPFSCFGIKNIEKKNNEEYIITLCYLDKYKQLFNNTEDNNFKDVPKTDFSELIFNSGIIDIEKIIMPDWFNCPNQTNDENIEKNNDLTVGSNYTFRMVEGINLYSSTASTDFMNNMNINDYFPNFIVLQSIEDNNLLTNVKNICISVLKYMQNNSINYANNYYSNDLINLRDFIQSQLVNFIGGQWYVNVNSQLLNYFENIQNNSVMVFQYNDIFIHISQIN